MLILSPRTEINLSNWDGQIDVPSWLLAPLALNEGAEYYSIYERQSSSRSQTEVLITTIPPTAWSDVWRAEIETIDKRGNYFILFDLFRANKIDVLSFEGAISVFGARNAMTFILGCNRYEDMDGSLVDDRIHQARPHLKGLELQIGINMADLTAFSGPDAPRIKLKRIDEYLLIHRQAHTQGTKIVEPAFGKPMQKKIALDPKRVLANFPKSVKVLQASVVSDSKNRLMRILLCSDERRAPGHVQYSVCRESAAAFSRICELAAIHNLNIIKSQVRIGARGEGCDDLGANDRLQRIDLTLEVDKSVDTTSSTVSAIVEFMADIKNDELLIGCGVRFTRSRSGITPDEKISV